jgi:hypothetical protein
VDNHDWQMKTLFSLGIVFLALNLNACFSKSIEPDLKNPIRTIAILPFTNQSNDISAPERMRSALSEALRLKHYKVMPIVEVDQALADKLGVTLGHHLQDMEVGSLRQLLRVDALVYGEITDFDQLISGALNSNRVSANFKMIQSTNPQNIIWHSYVGIKNEYSTNSLGTRLMNEGRELDKKSRIRWIDISDMNNQSVGGSDSNILQGLAAGLFSRNTEVMVGTTLVREVDVCINYSVENLAAGPGE